MVILGPHKVFQVRFSPWTYHMGNVLLLAFVLFMSCLWIILSSASRSQIWLRLILHSRKKSWAYLHDFHTLRRPFKLQIISYSTLRYLCTQSLHLLGILKSCRILWWVLISGNLAAILQSNDIVMDRNASWKHTWASWQSLKKHKRMVSPTFSCPFWGMVSFMKEMMCHISLN